MTMLDDATIHDPTRLRNRLEVLFSYKTRAVERNSMKFSTDVMSLEPHPNAYILTSYNR